MDTHKKDRAHISALVDGALPCIDTELALLALATQDGRDAWESYFLIGDTLRAAATPPLSPGFGAALAARLDAEPLPVRRPEGAATPATPAAVEAAPAREGPVDAA